MSELNEINNDSLESKEEAQENVSQMKKKVRPKLFRSSNEDIKITIVGYYNGETGELEFAFPENSIDDDYSESPNNMIVQKNTFIFSRVTYDRLNIYRKKSGQYNAIDKSTTIDFIKFRDLLWTFHLKSWDLKDDEGNDVIINHDADGTLSDESQRKLWDVPSMILDIVIQMFENKLNLI